MEPKAFKYLMAVQKERDDAALARMVTGEEEEQERPAPAHTEEDKRRESLTKILDLSRLDIQVKRLFSLPSIYSVENGDL
jgi:hypothetical protein